MARRVELNITKEQAAQLIDWLANDGYWGQAITRYEVEHGEEEVHFIINGHTLSNRSDQHHQVIIDDCYCYAYGCYGVYMDGKCYPPIEYCLYKLGF